MLVTVGLVFIQDPFGDVSIHVVQAPGGGFLLTDGLQLSIRVILEPSVVAELGRIIAEVPASGGAGTGGVFPFGLAGQAYFQTGFG